MRNMLLTTDKRISQRRWKNIGKRAGIFALSIPVCLMLSLPVYADGTEEKTDDTASTEETSTTVTNRVDLSEQYESDYDTYVESMDDVFYFYTNVANGSFTTGPVNLDISSDLSYVVEKDGTAISYTSGTDITEEGNYIVRLTGEYKSVIYESTFHFVIREATTTDSEDTDESSDSTSEESSDTTSDMDVVGMTDEELDQLDISEETIDTSEQVSQEDIDAIIEESGTELWESTGSSSSSDVNKYTGLNQTYSVDDGEYYFTMESGEVFRSNVPNGAVVSNTTVSIWIADEETVTASIYKDGEAYTSETMNFYEEGTYVVRFQASSVNFTRYYTEEGDYPIFTFRIVEHSVGDMEVFNAPEGCSIHSVYTSDGNWRDEDGNSEFELDSFWMDDETTYDFSVYNPDIDACYSVEITRDKTAPELSISTGRGTATLSAASSDIETVEVYKSGQAVELSDDWVINGNGTYTVVVTDYAGNSNIYQFTVSGGVSKNVVIMIVVYGILLIGVAGFLRYKNVNMQVR